MALQKITELMPLFNAWIAYANEQKDNAMCLSVVHQMIADVYRLLDNMQWSDTNVEQLAKLLTSVYELGREVGTY